MEPNTQAIDIEAAPVVEPAVSENAPATDATQTTPALTPIGELRAAFGGKEYRVVPVKYASHVDMQLMQILYVHITFSKTLLDIEGYVKKHDLWKFFEEIKKDENPAS